jgi:hypothetical protein
MLFIQFFNIYLVINYQLNSNVLWIYWYYSIAIRKLVHTLSLQKSIINNRGNIFKKKLYF